MPTEDGEFGKNSIKIEKTTIDDAPKATIDIQQGNLTGKLSSTKYGEIIKLMNAKRKDIDKPTYESKPTEGVEKMFFFFVHFEKDKSRGLILLERNGIYGINSVFKTLLKKFFSEFYENYILQVSTFLDSEIIKRIVKDGVAKSITLKTDKISLDTSDKLDFKDETQDYILELTIKKKKGFFGSNTRDIVKKLFDDKNKSHVISDAMESLGFDETSNVQVNFDYEGKRKKVNLEESLRSPRSVYDIYVEQDKYGNSIFKSITKQAQLKFELINPF